MKQLIFAAVIVVALVSCDLGGLRGNGHIVTEQRNVSQFLNLQVAGAFDVDWRSGPPSVQATGDENLLPFVELRVTDNTLRIRTTRSIRPKHSIKLLLTSSSLEAASFSGASRFRAHQMSAPKFLLDTSGASKIVLDGEVGDLFASMAGASDLRAETLRTENAELSVTGAGDAYVNVSESLKVSITGAGKVEYTGNPAHVERHITGAGTIKKRD